VNLVVNARDAMPDGGKLTLETALHLREGKPFVMLAVTDTGVGMRPEVQARIFEPFFTTKGEGRGTGLGLSTVLGIVKQAGGDIAVYSTPGKGTTFKVYLPYFTPGAPREQAEPPHAAGGNETVLVVEDQDPVRSAVHRTLSSTGYRVLEASRGRDALELIAKRKEPIDLVLTDWMLPDMTGQEMVRRMRGLNPRVRVLYMSGYAGGTLAHQGVVEPSMTFLQKPFTPDVLFHKVRAALDAAMPGGRA
jgi:two-component system, cell cycle sensor histidine kinase and response regulator CckA